MVRSSMDLDALLARRTFEQIVHLPQLTSPNGDILDLVDGPRWLVFSSAQVTSAVPAPGTDRALAREEAALRRGAAVLRPTMIFGRGGDANVSRLIRVFRRYRVPFVVGDGGQLLQPVHVDDMADLVASHRRRPTTGLFNVGGGSRLTARELAAALRTTLGLRLPVVSVPGAWVSIAAGLRLGGLREDQLRRLGEDKVVDIGLTCEAFSWRPHVLADRIAQAVAEVLEPSRE